MHSYKATSVIKHTGPPRDVAQFAKLFSLTMTFENVSPNKLSVA